MSKTTQKTAKTAAETARETASKALAEKQAGVRQTALYGRIKAAVEKGIADAAAEGKFGAPVFATAKIPGELGSPETTVAEALSECEDTILVAETLAADLESRGYKVLRLFGCPLAVTWGED